MAWHDVGAHADLGEDQPLSVKIGDHEIGVYTINGKLHAIEDVCPHAYALLSQGFVMGDIWPAANAGSTAERLAGARRRRSP